MVQNIRTKSASNTNERLVGLEGRMDNFEHTLGSFSTELGVFGTELRNLGSKINDVLALASSKQSFEPLTVLKAIALIIALFGGMTGGITFVASSVSDSRLAVIEFQTQQLWQRDMKGCANSALIQRNP